MGDVSNGLSLLKIIGKIIKWCLFIILPVSLAFTIYLNLSVTDLDSLTNGDAAKLVKSFLKEVIGRYPFVEQFAKILSKSFKYEGIKFSNIVDDIIQALLCYSLVDWLKYAFNVRNGIAKIETKFSKWVKLGIIYTTWFFLTAYVTNIVIHRLFDLLEQLSKTDLIVIKSFLILTFFVISVLVFKYRTRENILLCTLWTLSEKIVFPILTTLLLSFLGYWSFQILTTSNRIDKYDMVIPIIIYLIIAASIDYLKDTTRFGIVSLAKKH